MASKAAKIGGAIVSLALLAAAAACGSDDSSSDPPGGAQASPGTSEVASGDGCTADRVGGSISMGVFSEVQGLDPAGSPGAGSTGGSEHAAIFDTLVIYDRENHEWEPHVAESVTSNSDGSVWTIKVRSGIKFGNGDPLNAEAVAFSLERLGAAESRSSVKRSLATAQVEIVDDMTVQVTLPEPWQGFPYVLARAGGMITNPAVVAADPEGFTRNPAGGGVGPYEVVRYAPGEELVLKAKDDYWGGPVCVEDLRFVHVPSGAATLDALELDEIQVAMIADPSTVQRAIDEGFPTISNPVNYAEGLLLNNGLGDTEPPTSDVRLREAISLAIDPEQINARAWDGNGFPTTALVMPDSSLSPGVEGPGQDPSRARRLVDEVKADGWDGKLRMICDNAPDRVESSLAMQAMLGAVGIDVEVNNSVTIPDLIATVLVNRDFDTACWGQGAFDEGLWFTYNTFHSESPANQSGYGDPEMDAALDALARAASADEIRDAVGEMQGVWNETFPGVIYAGGNFLIPHKDTVHGLTPTTSAIVLFHDAYAD